MVTIQPGDWCPELDLEPGVVTTVTFAGQDLNSVEVVVTGSTGTVRWTCDGSTPSEDAGWYVPADGVDEREPATSGSTVVKLWSSGSAKACVQRG